MPTTLAAEETTSTPGIVAHALHSLVSHLPSSTEKTSGLPAVRAHGLAKGAAIKAAALSGGFTLPPGPFGMATVLPDLLAVWRIQQQLVADIAAVYGRSDALSAETMILCLFKHGGASLVQRLLSRSANDSVVVNKIATRALQHMLEKIAVRIGQRLAAKSVSRWLPILGAVGAGAYAYYDTMQVAKNAQELFSRPLHLGSDLEPESSPPSEPASSSPPAAAEPTTSPSSTPKRRRKKPAVTKTPGAKSPRRPRTRRKAASE